MPDEVNNATEDIDVDSSILLSVKKVIGQGPADTSFDTDIIMHINSGFFKLKQYANMYSIFVTFDVSNPSICRSLNAPQL